MLTEQRIYLIAQFRPLKKLMGKVVHILVLCAIFFFYSGIVAQAAPTIRDVRDTVRAILLDVDHGAHIFIKKGEVLEVRKIYHDNGNAWSWNEYIAFEACPYGDGMCAVPFMDTKGNAYSLVDRQHVGEDALSTVGFYNVQSAQGHWNLFMIRMERSTGDSTYDKSPTIAHVSLFKIAPHVSGVAMPVNNFFEEIATLPVGDYCNSNVALLAFLGQSLPKDISADGCM